LGRLGRARSYLKERPSDASTLLEAKPVPRPDKYMKKKGKRQA